jgi:hypothetical protein
MGVIWGCFDADDVTALCEVVAFPALSVDAAVDEAPLSAAAEFCETGLAAFVTLNQMAVPARTVPKTTQLRAAALFRFPAGFTILALLPVFTGNRTLNLN